MARFAETYRANKKSHHMPRTDHVLDRATWRGLQRTAAREKAGRWGGVGDPAAMRSLAKCGPAARNRAMQIAA